MGGYIEPIIRLAVYTGRFVEGLFWACVELKISTEQFPVCGKPYFLSDIIATVAIVSDEILTAIVGFIYNKMSVKASPKITESAHTESVCRHPCIRNI